MGDECTAVPGTFTCPPTFTEVVNTEGLCVEDVQDDDQELWVIQASCDVDFADLNDQQLLLNSQTLLQLPSYEDEIIEVLPKDTLDLDNQLNEEITNAHLVLPNRSSMELQTVKKDFKGFLFVNRNVLVSQLNLIEDEPKNSTRPENLKKHDKAFGSGDPLGFFGMDGNTAVDFMESASESSQNSRKKHSRSTKDHRHSEHIAVKSKKKHHRDKKEQVAVEIKTEVTSDYEKCLSSSEESKETKDKRHKTVDSENNNLRVSHDEENAVPRMKKKKHRTVVDEVTENELPSEIAELELSEHSPSKLHRKKNKHKKKYKSPDSSHMEEEDFDASSQDKKAKHKSRRLKEIPSEESLDYQNNSMCIPEVQIKQEIFDEHLNGLDLGNSLSHSKKKKSKKEKKRHRE